MIDFLQDAEPKKEEPYRPKTASAQMNYLMSKRLFGKMKLMFDLRTLMKDNK